MDRRDVLWYASAAAMGAAAGVGIYGAGLEPRTLDVRHARSPTRPGPGAVDRPPIRVALLTDLHLGRLTSFHRSVVDELIRAAPDLVVLGGDSVDDRRGLDALDTFLGLLPGGIPLLGIMGNWEYWGGIAASDLRSLVENHGGALLVNAATTLDIGDRRLVVTGVDDSVAGEPDADLARRPVEEGADHLILAHCPVFRDELAAAAATPPGASAWAAGRVSVILSGHTHGGQVALPGRPFTPPGSGRYVEGWYTGSDAPPMYVSRGLGTSVVPIRIGCRPELPIIEL